jgi:hypothetical protein
MKENTVTVINPKKFADRLIDCLEKADYKPHEYQNALKEILKHHYKELGIDAFSLNSLLTGSSSFVPNDKLVNFLAEEFGEDPDWLSGRKNIHTPPKP